VQLLPAASYFPGDGGVDLETSNRALGLGRSKGYELAKRGQYPCKVLRLGKAYRVVTADLLNLLGLAA
jgi:hypothetical protein